LNSFFSYSAKLKDVFNFINNLSQIYEYYQTKNKKSRNILIKCLCKNKLKIFNNNVFLFPAYKKKTLITQGIIMYLNIESNAKKIRSALQKSASYFRKIF